jgi:hypothetical protein
VNVVVVPFFHLRWAAYAWPPSGSERAQARATFGAILRDPRFRVRESNWFATVRLAPGG